MSRRKRNSHVLIWTILGVGIVAATQPVFADCLGDTAGWTCVCENSSSNPTICVKWVEGAPVQPTHFVVDFSCTGCPSAPNVTLKQSSDWRVWSYDSTNGLGDIGDITIDNSGSGSYWVRIMNDAGDAGAVDVSSIILDDAGWTGYSSINGGKIYGDLGNLTVIEDVLFNGGDFEMEVGGDVTGTVVIPNLTRLLIGNDVAATAFIDIGYVRGNDSNGANTIEFDIGRDVVGDIRIDNLWNTGFLDVDLRVGRNVSGLIDVGLALGRQYHFEVFIVGDVNESGEIRLDTMGQAWVKIGGDLIGTYKVTEIMARSCMYV